VRLYKRWTVFCFFAMLQSCAQIDDYMLGKDNTPKPGELPAIQSAVKISEKWSIAVGKSHRSHRGYLKLKPAISGDTLYVADPQGTVLAVDKSTGAIRWSMDLKQGVVSGPVVGHGVIALGTSNSGLILLNQEDGHERWQANVSGDILSSPLLTKKRVIVKTIDGRIYAFDRLTGKKQWKMDHGTPSLILKVSSSPINMGRLVLVGFPDGKLDAVDKDSGQVIWQRSIVYASGSSDVERLVDIDADPIVQGEVVYLASFQGYVGAMLLSNGQFIWNKPASTYNNLGMDDNAVYMTDSNDTVWAFNKKNGQVQWKQPNLAARGLTAPVVMDHKLLVGDKTGFIHVLNTQQGELMARLKLGGAIEVAPTLSGHDAYIMTDSGQLTCLSVGE
jgi:outer membrane protein assembly factor BamB